MLEVTLTTRRLGAAEKPEGFVSDDSASDSEEAILTLFERGNYTTYNDVIVYEDDLGHTNSYFAENETHVFDGFEWEEIEGQKRRGEETLDETYVVWCVDTVDLVMCASDDYGEAYFTTGCGSS